MYYYVYDSFVKKDKQAFRRLEKVNAGLTRFGMLGEIAESDSRQGVRDMVQQGIDKGHSTIVVIGDNRTLHEAANAVLAHEHVALGMIPVGGDISLAHSLGIDDLEALPEVLSARKVEKIDLGVVNDQVFIGSLDFYGSSAILDQQKVRLMRRSPLVRLKGFFSYLKKAEARELDLEVDSMYRIHARTPHLSFVNIRTSDVAGDVKGKQARVRFDSNMGRLHLVIVDDLPRNVLYRHSGHITDREYERIPHTSFFEGDRFAISSPQPLDLWADNVHIGTTPATIGIIPKQLKMIVGKRRLF
jgi:diacylglycerol kinase family enzyme